MKSLVCRQAQRITHRDDSLEIAFTILMIIVVILTVDTKSSVQQLFPFYVSVCFFHSLPLFYFACRIGVFSRLFVVFTVELSDVASRPVPRRLVYSNVGDDVDV